MTIKKKYRLTVCSTTFALALWGMTSAITADIKLEKNNNGKIRTTHVAPQDDRSVELLRLADGSAVDTEWAHFRGAVDTEWA